MYKRLRSFGLVFLCLALWMPRAEAYYGYWYGWNFNPYFYGAGQTVQGSILQGMGVYLQGAGEYNLLTAQAGAINTSSWITLNEYLYNSNRLMAARYAKRTAAKLAKRKELREKRYLQLRDNPTERDVRTGDALNLKIRLLTGPATASAVYDKAQVAIPAELLGVLPLRRAADAASLTIGGIKQPLAWPLALEVPGLSNERVAIEKALETTYASIEKGKISEQQLLDLTNAIDSFEERLKAKDFAKVKPAGHAYAVHLRAVRRSLGSKYLVAGMQKVSQTKDLTLGGLLRTMNVYGISLGVATTPEQIEAYQRLYTVIGAIPSVLDEGTLESLADYMSEYKY